MSSPSEPAPAGTTLAAVAKGDHATIVELLDGENPSVADHVRRLADLGFLPGERVQVVACGIPAGDPIAVRLGHATFALRRFEADMIRVTTGPGSAG